MADTGKGQEERRVHTIRWETDDWERITRCAEVLSAELHLDLGPTDVIRTAVRRLCDEKIGAEGDAVTVPETRAAS